MDEKEIKSLLSQVLHFLSFRSRSEAEIMEYLVGKDVEVADFPLVMERVKELGLIDDEDFARQLIESKRKKQYGPKKIHFDLLNKGISSSVAKVALAKFNQDQWEETISAYFAKKRVSPENLADPTFKQKLKTSLYARGFESSSIKNAIDSLGSKE